MSLPAAPPLLPSLLLLLLLPLALGLRGNVEEDDAPALRLQGPAAEAHAGASQRLGEIQGRLDELRAGLEQAFRAGAMNETLKGTLKDLIKKLSDSQEDLPINVNLNPQSAATWLGEVDKRIQATSEALHVGQNVPVAEIIKRKSLLHGVLLQIPPVQGTFPDTVVQFREGALPQELLDPRDNRKQEFTAHFISQRMSQMATMASMTFGSSVLDFIPGVESVVGAFASLGGPLGAAFSIASSVQATAELKTRAETLQKQEVDLHVVWEPRGAIAIDFADLQLVPPALEMLDEVADEKNKEIRASMLGRFLRRFGSHVCSKVTLGGTRRTRAILRTEASVSSKDARIALKKAALKDQAREVASMSGAGSGGAIGSATDSAAGASPAALGYSSGVGNLEDTVTIEKEIDGGTSGLPTGLWVNTLASSENWEVIDRHVGDCMPIWDFLRRDRKASLDKEQAKSGMRLDMEMFQVWYQEFLNLKEHFKASPKAPQFVAEEQLVDWIASEYQKLQPALKFYQQCDNTNWCGGHGDCGPETRGLCSCHPGYKEVEKTCVRAVCPFIRSLGCLGFLAGHRARGRGLALLELDGPGRGVWDDALVQPWLQLLEGEDFVVNETEVAYMDEALARIIDDAKTEADLVQVLETSMQAMQALLEFLATPEYRAHLMQDTRDLAHILSLEGAKDYLAGLERTSGEQASGLKLLQSIVENPQAKHSLSTKLALFAQRLGEPSFVTSAESLLRQRMETMEKLLKDLEGTASRHQVANLLSSKARQVLAEASLGTMDESAEKSVQSTLVDRVLPLQRKASADLVAGLKDLQGAGAQVQAH